MGGSIRLELVATLDRNTQNRYSEFWILIEDEFIEKSWVDEHGRTNEITKEECPHCKKTGSVYAWFEKNAIWSEKCKKCGNRGKLLVKEKLDIGIVEKEINCDHCDGTGKVNFSGERVHIKTKGGYWKEQLEEDETELEVNQSFCKGGEQGEDVANYRKFYVIITNKNRKFYSTSKPRQL